MDTFEKSKSGENFSGLVRNE